MSKKGDELNFQAGTSPKGGNAFGFKKMQSKRGDSLDEGTPTGGALRAQKTGLRRGTLMGMKSSDLNQLAQLEGIQEEVRKSTEGGGFDLL